MCALPCTYALRSNMHIPTALIRGQAFSQYRSEMRCGIDTDTYLWVCQPGGQAAPVKLSRCGAQRTGQLTSK